MKKALKRSRLKVKHFLVPTPVNTSDKKGTVYSSCVLGYNDSILIVYWGCSDCVF